MASGLEVVHVPLEECLVGHLAGQPPGELLEAFLAGDPELRQTEHWHPREDAVVDELIRTHLPGARSPAEAWAMVFEELFAGEHVRAVLGAP